MKVQRADSEHRKVSEVWSRNSKIAVSRKEAKVNLNMEHSIDIIFLIT
jgi:hypothetical protein